MRGILWNVAFSKSSFEVVWLTQWDDKVWQVEKKELIGDEEPGCWLVFHSFTSSGGRGLLIFQSGNQGQLSYFELCKMFTLLNSSVGILDEVLEKGRAETVNYSSSVMFHICQVSKLCLESAGIAWERVSVIPVPSHYQEWKPLIPVPEIREWIFYFPSRSQFLAAVAALYLHW